MCICKTVPRKYFVLRNFQSYVSLIFIREGLNVVFSLPLNLKLKCLQRKGVTDHYKNYISDSAIPPENLINLRNRLFFVGSELGGKLGMEIAVKFH